MSSQHTPGGPDKTDSAFDYRSPDVEHESSPKKLETELVKTPKGSPLVGFGDSTSHEVHPSLVLEDAGEWLPMTDSFRNSVVQGLYIGTFAIFGSLLRILTAQFFGEECANPGTVGWLASGSPLCVTAGGSTTEQGGIVFADLPANMLGSFVMGLFATCETLKLAHSSNMKIAWLKPNNSFQQMPILHKAITTGFCGSLTTFSGWNSSMVVLLYGTGSSRTTHVFNAIFGYIVGMEVAVGCYVGGKSLARRLYRTVNPVFSNESDAQEIRREEGVFLNPELPDFERRFLPNLDMGRYGEKDYGETVPSRVEYLAAWRASTKEVRRVHHPLLPALITIEKAVLVDGGPVPLEAESTAHIQGWNTEALREWTRARDKEDSIRLPSISRSDSSALLATPQNRLFTISVAAAILGVLMVGLLIVLLTLQSNHAYTITNRTMVYAMLCAPFGAILRWELSVLNGTLTWDGWTWFPLGTFSANFIGSVMSIAAIALEYKMEPVYQSFWGIGTLRAVKVGFVGSLTTVSTFVAEINAYVVEHTDHAYPYMLTTLACCCGAASIIYGIMVY